MPKRLTANEAAARAGMSVPTLYRHWKLGTGPHSFKIGGKRLVSEAALEAWLTSFGG
jgi:excisionase family DNA binding protein